MSISLLNYMYGNCNCPFGMCRHVFCTYSVHTDVSEVCTFPIIKWKDNKGLGRITIEEFHNPYSSNIVRAINRGAQLLDGRSTLRSRAKRSGGRLLVGVPERKIHLKGLIGTRLQSILKRSMWGRMEWMCLGAGISGSLLWPLVFRETGIFLLFLRTDTVARSYKSTALSSTGHEGPEGE